MTALRLFRALARIEVRQLKRHPGRSLLLILLVAVPVAAVAGGATLARIIDPTADEQRARLLGTAALRIDAVDDAAEAARLGRLLPRGTPHVRLFRGHERVAVPGRQLEASLVALGPGALDAGGLARGIVVMDQGRAPVHAGEVALSPVLLAALGTALGDTVTLEYGPRRIITGVVLDPGNLDQALVVRTPAAVEYRGAWSILVGREDDGGHNDTARVLREAGFGVQRRADVHGGDGALGTVILILGIIGLVEAALVMAATFAVGLRRRQYDIGLLGSSGAPAGAIRTAIIGCAAGMAALGGAVGVAVGIGAARLAHPYLDVLNRRLNGPFDIHPPHLVAAVLLGITAAVAAAAVPAWRAAGMPIRQALGGRQPAAPRSHRWPAAGFGVIALGLALLAAARLDSRAAAGAGMIGGPILVLIGAGLLAPWLLERAAAVAARLPLGWRLAVRDAGRFSDRNGPVVAAVLAGMSLSVALAVLTTSLETAMDALPAPWRDDQLVVEGPGAAAVAARLKSELSGVAAAPLAAVYAGRQPVRARYGSAAPATGTRAWVATGNAELLRALDLDAGRAAFLAGNLLVLGAPDDAPPVELTGWLDGRPLPAPPATRLPLGQSVSAPRFVLDESRLAALGFETGPPIDRSLVPWLVRLPSPVTPAILERARALAATSAGTVIDADLLHRRPARAVYRAALAVCLLTGLLIVLVSTSLSAAESAGDDVILHAVGAPPHVLRDHRGRRAAWLALLGGLLAVPVGLATVTAILLGVNFPLPVILPWPDLAVIFLGLPLIAWGGAWLLGGGGVGRATAWLVGAALAVGAAGPAVASAAVATPFVAPPAVHDIAWQPWTGTAFDGSPLPGQIGRITVPENRDAPNGRTIELAVVRYRTTNPHPGPPIVFLAGGPGGSGVELAGRQATHPQIRLLEQRDVIGLDQRGTGLSRPNLVEAPEFVQLLPLDRPVTPADVRAAYAALARRGVNHWAARGVDPAAYHTNASADDVDDLRRALGLATIALYGASYGSHLGLACLRRHPASIEQAVLLNVEGPDQTWKRPALVQWQLARLHDDARRDPAVSALIPDLLGCVRQLRAQLARRSVTVASDTIPGAPPIVIGRLDFDTWMADALASTTDRAGLPAALHRFTQGDWTGLAASARGHRRISLAVMPLLMDCASGASAARRILIEAERQDPANLLADAVLDATDPVVCRAAGIADRAEVDAAPHPCDVPVLFVSGTLDVRTPPDNVAAIQADFTRHAHVVVDQAAHDGRELMSPDYRAILQAFLRGETVPSTALTLPPVRFTPIKP